MSTINIQCVDQVLTITNSPVIASGGLAENYIQISFCQLWEGYAKVAVFYRQRGENYYSLISMANRCVIPAECCTSEGKVHFGVVGFKDGDIRTSNVLTYRLVEGAVTEIDDPSPSIYQQILDELADIREALENQTMPIKDLTAETTLSDSDAFPFYDVSADINRKTLWSNIKSVLKTYFDTIYTTSAAVGTQITTALASYVPNTRKVNNKALSSDIALTASDVGAVPTNRTVNSKALSSDIALTASDVGAVPTSRKVNNKALSSDIALTASDVGALPLAGGTMTGALTLAADPSQALQAATKQYVDADESYSTSEVATGGTWIDNRAIYKKTYSVTNLSPAGGYYTIGQLTGFREIIDIRSVMYAGGIHAYVAPVLDNNGYIGISDEGETSAIDKWTATLYYTKS